MKDHVIETEEYFVVGEKKIFLSKRVYYDYIFYSKPYIEDENASKKIKDIFDFVDSSPSGKNNIYLNTRFDVDDHVAFYDTCHKRNYNEITEEGLKYFYNDICGFEEPTLIKKIRESSKECKLHKISVDKTGVVVSLTFGVKKQDLLEFLEYLNFAKIDSILSIFDDIEHITPSWMIRFDVTTNSIWIGFSDNISVETYIEEHLFPQYYSIDWFEIKKKFYGKLVENNAIKQSQYDYMMRLTKGKQPTITYFQLKNDEIEQIHFENMITYKFESIEGA